MTHDQREIHRKKRVLEDAERFGNIRLTEIHHPVVDTQCPICMSYLGDCSADSLACLPERARNRRIRLIRSVVVRRLLIGGTENAASFSGASGFRVGPISIFRGAA